MLYLFSVSYKVNDYFSLKHPAAILIFRKTDILTFAVLHIAVNPEDRNSLSVPIDLTVPTDSSYYISFISETTSPLCRRNPRILHRDKTPNSYSGHGAWHLRRG